MLRGEILFSNNETNLALKIYTEVLNLFPDVLEAYEMRAQCYLIEVREKLFNKKTTLYLLKRYQLIITQWWTEDSGEEWSNLLSTSQHINS